MAAKNSKLPGHKWVVSTGRVVKGPGILYRCTKCHHETLSGEPLEKPYDEECK